MKALFIASILLAYPLNSYAYCGDTFSGKSGSTRVSISNEDCGSPDLTISYWELNKDGSPNRESYKSAPFKQECTPNIGIGFTCKVDGITPLAGTTYIKTKNGTDPCDKTGKTKAERNECVKGCDKPTVPKYLDIEPYEC